MFLGEYQHSLDAKGRVILPSKYRDQLSGGAYVTKGRGGCLSVYAAQEFSEVADRVREASKRGRRELDAARSFFAGTAEVTPGQAGPHRDPAAPAGVRGPRSGRRGGRGLLPGRDLGRAPLVGA